MNLSPQRNISSIYNKRLNDIILVYLSSWPESVLLLHRKGVYILSVHWHSNE